MPASNGAMHHYRSPKGGNNGEASLSIPNSPLARQRGIGMMTPCIARRLEN
jgi:hypothetical protein